MFNFFLIINTIYIHRLLLLLLLLLLFSLYKAILGLRKVSNIVVIYETANFTENPPQKSKGLLLR